MDLSDYVGTLRSELGSIGRFAGEDITRAAEMLAEALDSSVRLTLLDVLSAAAEEITTRLEDTVVDVRLSAGEPEFVVSTAAAHVPDDPPGQSQPDGWDDSGSARITLRLSESLKTRVEAAAAAAGMSVNGWLVHAAVRALENPDGRGVRRARTGVGQRITGYARS